MKRCTSLLIVLFGLAACSAMAGQEVESSLLLVTGAYYDEGGQVLVKAHPVRIELPLGVPEEAYRLAQESERTFELREDAYVAVPQDIPIGKVKLSQAQAADFPIYLSEFLYSLEHTYFEVEPPEKGDGIVYTDYSLLYRAAVSGNSILSLSYHELD